MSVRVEVATDPAYVVRVGADILGEVAAFVGRRKVALVADARAFELHGERLTGLPGSSRFTHLPGEDAKTLQELGKVLDFLAEERLDRNSLVVTFGGGVTTDLGGLAASLFKRGIGVVHVPTTLLAQVDAAIGGKTAINLRAGKNLAGTFHQPLAIFADTSVLATLDTVDFTSGLGEAVKSAVLVGEDSIAHLEESAEEIVARDQEALTQVVVRCAKIKAAIIASDPHEQGGRRALNLGHTFAHAIESAAGYGVIPHGVAVAVGVVLAVRASEKTGRLVGTDMSQRLVQLSRGLELPHSLDTLRSRYDLPLGPGDLLRGMRHDKKGAVGKPEFILPTGYGSLELHANVEPNILRELLEPA